MTNKYNTWAQTIFVDYPIYNFIESKLGLRLTGAEKMLLRQSIYEYEPFLRTLADAQSLYLSRSITLRILNDFEFTSKQFTEYKKQVSKQINKK